MFEIADRLIAALDAGERMAVATIVSVVGSAPRAVGTSMAVGSNGTIVGSLSGGCVEGAVYEVCEQVRQSGVPQLVRYGSTDGPAFSVALTCGGQIEVVVTLLAADDGATSPALAALRQAASGHPARLTTVLDGDRLGHMLSGPATGTTACDESRVFTETTQQPARMLIFGAAEFSVALCNAAVAVGYRVTVCDPRPLFLSQERFPAADELVLEWPTDYLARAEVDERTVIAILSHDERFDTDLIEAAVRLPAAYIGAMGSRTTHERRMTELNTRGATGLGRLHSPIGLNLSASTPEETAVSILAEIIAARSGAGAEPLTVTSGAIHGVVSPRGG